MKNFLLTTAYLFCFAFISAAQVENVPLLSEYAPLADNECIVCFHPMEGQLSNVVVASCYKESSLHGLCNNCLESEILRQCALKDFKGLKCSRCTLPYQGKNKKNIARLVAGKPYAPNLFVEPEKRAATSSLLCCCFRSDE
jgi:hypothetical protein